MILTDPVKNDQGKLQVSILDITDDEIVFLKNAIKSYKENNIDDDDEKTLKRANDWMEISQAAFKKVRPS